MAPRGPSPRSPHPGINPWDARSRPGGRVGRRPPRPPPPLPPTLRPNDRTRQGHDPPPTGPTARPWKGRGLPYGSTTLRRPAFQAFTTDGSTRVSHSFEGWVFPVCGLYDCSPRGGAVWDSQAPPRAPYDYDDRLKAGRRLYDILYLYSSSPVPGRGGTALPPGRPSRRPRLPNEQIRHGLTSPGFNKPSPNGPTGAPERRGADAPRLGGMFRTPRHPPRHHDDCQQRGLRGPAPRTPAQLPPVQLFLLFLFRALGHAQHAPGPPPSRRHRLPPSRPTRVYSLRKERGFSRAWASQLPIARGGCLELLGTPPGTTQRKPRARRDLQVPAHRTPTQPLPGGPGAHRRAPWPLRAGAFAPRTNADGRRHECPGKLLGTHRHPPPGTLTTTSYGRGLRAPPYRTAGSTASWGPRGTPTCPPALPAGTD